MTGLYPKGLKNQAAKLLKINRLLRGVKLPRNWLWPIYGSIILAGIGSIVWLSRDAGPANYWHVAPLIGSFLLAVGWIVTSENTIRSDARQHTISVILGYQSNKEITEAWELIRKYLKKPDDKLVPGGSIPNYDQDDHELFQAVDFQLNRFEFISLGILSGTFDVPMMRNSFIENFLNLHKRVKPYIDYTREKRPNIWDNYCTVCDRWARTRRDGGPGQPEGNPYSMFANIENSSAQRLL